MEITVREAAAADRAIILDLGKRTIVSSASEIRPASQRDLERGYERLVTFVRDQSHVILIAESSMEKLGFLIMLDKVPDEVSGAPQAFVAYMAVEPHVRRHGVARVLLRGAEETASERGLSALALMVTESNREARELYAQAGFTTERRLLVKAL